MSHEDKRAIEGPMKRQEENMRP